MSPQSLEDSGWPSRIGSLIVSPTQATCLSPTSSNVLDFFVCSETLHSTVTEIHAVTRWRKKPHRPVILTTKADPASLLKLVVDRPAALPTTLPFGPRPRPGEWTESIALAKLAADASQALPVCQVSTLISKAWTSFSNAAEEETARITGAELKQKVEELACLRPNGFH